ncbi:SUMF1/EgtB/PvdO family nonheme iron enzyme [Halosquirtibacter laminarini]|uniref:SUMF1/EgtB/PvdO family nonheme iron enzyme n=2 Tax=Halosquirtibacter laminarini TaxID=3374600 RepID=A0AC61NQF3_9BACT|nr:SUMF1/EgtB/PvdO family nonheme iron enzyme [Prolixibacteraceae bacterium]
MSSCSLFKKKGGGSGERSATTGWEYNNPDNGGFEYKSGYEQAAGPGLVYVQGGTFTMGRVEQDVMFNWNNTPRRVTVASFYMDETEVRNVDWREYLHWIERVYPDDKKEFQKALPDTLVWREELSYNEPYLENYLRHPAFSDYPVVGVSWVQASNYCKWRTDRVNEQILIDNGILTLDAAQQGQEVFTTESYYAGLYKGVDGKSPIEDLSKESGNRRVKQSDGILLPRYRLPTEAEWEFAALGLQGNTKGELLTERRIYPWNGHHLRYGNDDKKNRGKIRANFTRSRGDLMGLAGHLNDGFDITGPVTQVGSNDLGLYGMAGNVNEWVYDVYRPLSSMDVSEFQPIRGNVYTQYRKDADGNLQRDEHGRLVKDTVANYVNFNDGDYQSRIILGDDWTTTDNKKKGSNSMYPGDPAGNVKPRIDDHVRVYKGGSWKDRPYWLSPGSRRYTNENSSTDDIGFRCAMTHLGDPDNIDN